MRQLTIDWGLVHHIRIKGPNRRESRLAGGPQRPPAHGPPLTPSLIALAAQSDKRRADDPVSGDSSASARVSAAVGAPAASDR
jgi:hypothetical protein